MKLAIINFTLKGGIINKNINDGLKAKGYDVTSFTISKFSKELGFFEIGSSLKEWTEKMFKEMDGIIFIGACGIAVRAIAPFVKDKKSDPAVIVIDEKGKFVISLLSGHIGGANNLTKEIANIVEGQEVITTATDVNGRFAVDTFATQRGIHISNVRVVKKISSRILENKEVGLYTRYKIKNSLPEGVVLKSHGDVGICISIKEDKPFVETLNLIPKTLILGIGCRKNTDQKKIESLVMKILKQNNIPIEAVKSVASIDLKKNEEGILGFCNKYNLPFNVYSSEQLENVKGEFTKSDFVKSITGVSNVCERSAVMESNNGQLIIRKTAEDGVTVAAALEDWSVEF